MSGNITLREGKHDLTDTQCLVDHGPGELPCRFCSRCRQLIPFRLWGSDCPLPAPPFSRITTACSRFDGKMLVVGFRGSADQEAGYVHAPYMPRERKIE